MHTVTSDNAEQILGWLRTRGGIAIWPSVNMSDLGLSWTTPALTDGKPTTKPTWQAGETPEIITDPAQVLVSVDREVKRFHVAVRTGSQGLSLKVSDGGSRRIRKAVAAAGEGAYHVFDYGTQEAVIMNSVTTVPILEWLVCRGEC
jgi:hypothetical protein